MKPNETFQGAKAAFTYHNFYLTTVGQEFGIAKAIALESLMCNNIGAMQGKFIRDKSGIKAFDAKIAYRIVKNVPEGYGIIGEVLEESPEKVRFKCRNCSIYEGAQNAGLDEKTREAICRKGSIRYMDAMVKQLHPNLSYRLMKYRTSADDFCEEEIVMKQSNGTCFGI